MAPSRYNGTGFAQKKNLLLQIYKSYIFKYQSQLFLCGKYCSAGAILAEMTLQRAASPDF
jgi:hypothetical protein